MKKKNTFYNEDIVKNLLEKYGLSRDFILKSIRGDRTSRTSDAIKKEYEALDKQVKQIINAN